MENICTIDTHSAQTLGVVRERNTNLTLVLKLLAILISDFCQIFDNLGRWPDSIKKHQDVDELSFINLLWRFYIKNITDTI